MKKKIYLIAIAIVVICAVIFVATKKQKPDTREKYALFTFIDTPYNEATMKLYRNNKLIYEGTQRRFDRNHSLKMFISNFPKEDSTKFRLVVLDADTTFYVRTMDYDSLMIVMGSPKHLWIYDAKDIREMIID